MRLIRGLTNITARDRPAVVSIGNFDGVHLGHQEMLKRLCERAAELGRPTALVTFEPLPQEFFAAAAAPARLMGLREKLQYLARHSDLDAVLCLRFDQRFSLYSAEQFVAEVLVEGLRAQHVLLGDDFRFGHQRRGDIHLLERMGAASGFTVEAMPSFTLDGQRVSSTAVRRALAAGDLAAAGRLLGRPYCLSGRVVRGDQLGRTLGFATANIHLRQRPLALSGVFAVMVSGVADTALPGMANIGWRPTVGGRERRFEVHVFDLEADLYGRHIEVAFVAKLREEQGFASLAALKAQLAVDEQAARQQLSDFFNVERRSLPSRRGDDHR